MGYGVLSGLLRDTLAVRIAALGLYTSFVFMDIDAGEPPTSGVKRTHRVGLDGACRANKFSTLSNTCYICYVIRVTIVTWI